METLTIEKQLIEQSSHANTMVELMNNIQPIINDVMATDNRLLSVDKQWINYGTWKVTVWANDYHFGKELTQYLKKISIITHDEDKKFTIKDLETEIREMCETYAYDKF